MKNKLTLSIMIVFAIGSNAFSQTSSFAINSTGGSYTLNANTYEWSIGEMTLVNTAISPNLIVTQGLLQPILTTVGIGPDKDLRTNFKVFPNPTNGLVFIQINLPAQTNLAISVFDIQGRLLIQKELFLDSGLEQQELDFNSFVSGVYFITLRSKNNGQDVTNTFKVEKII